MSKKVLRVAMIGPLTETSQPPRKKRAIQKANAANAKVISGPHQLPKALPNADSAAPAKANPMAQSALQAALGRTKAVAPRTVKFERAPQGGDQLWASGLGVRRRAPSVVYGYVRDAAPTTPEFMQRWADAGAHEVRRESKHGRPILQGLLSQAAKGDTILVERLSDLAVAQALPGVVRDITAKGIHIKSFDGADTTTDAGRHRIASAVLASRKLFGGLRI